MYVYFYIYSITLNVIRQYQVLHIYTTTYIDIPGICVIYIFCSSSNLENKQKQTTSKFETTSKKRPFLMDDNYKLS